MKPSNKPTEYRDLEVDFRHNVDDDNSFFKLSGAKRSVYLPNPFFTATPQYVLIAMEPSTDGTAPEIIEDNVNNKGHVNFMYSQEDIILHYCAYTYLCNNSFSYHITDVAKGAMLTDYAKNIRDERWNLWTELLLREIELLKCENVIAIGATKTYKFLSKHINGKRLRSVYHYSGQWNKSIFRSVYDENHAVWDQSYLTKLFDFSRMVMQKAGLSKAEVDKMIGAQFSMKKWQSLSDWKKGLFLYYQSQFGPINS